MTRPVQMNLFFWILLLPAIQEKHSLNGSEKWLPECLSLLLSEAASELLMISELFCVKVPTR